VIYLDHAATTPVRPEVLEAMFPYFQSTFGNPSSVHSAGAQAAVGLEQARGRVAGQLGASAEEIIFTSGGTEADNLALIGTAHARAALGDHVVISAIEHEAVVQSARRLESEGFRVSVAPVDRAGVIDVEAFGMLVNERTILVSCMYANNEVGTVQPMAEISAAVRERSQIAVIHTDFIQAAGHIPLDLRRVDIDLLSISGHKIYGPRGVGALFVRGGVDLEPTMVGGMQEYGRRSGTENVAGAVGLATAFDLVCTEMSVESERLTFLRDAFIDAVASSDLPLELTGSRRQRLPGHVSFVVHGRTAESVLVDLDMRGIMSSSGSACHAGQTDPSHVLMAMGFDSIEAKNGLRFTLGRDTTMADIEMTVSALDDILAGTRHLSTSRP
jgi:cysteine desulfurase